MLLFFAHGNKPKNLEFRGAKMRKLVFLLIMLLPVYGCQTQLDSAKQSASENTKKNCGRSMTQRSKCKEG